MRGYTDFVKELTRAGASVAAQDQDGLTAVDLVFALDEPVKDDEYCPPVTAATTPKGEEVGQRDAAAALLLAATASCALTRATSAAA